MRTIERRPTREAPSRPQSGGPARHADLLRLQRTAGNRATTELMLQRWDVLGAAGRAWDATTSAAGSAWDATTSAVGGAARATGRAAVRAGQAVGDAGRAAGRAALRAGQAVGDAAVAAGRMVFRSDFDDLNATQYLVGAGGRVEAINRRVEDGQVVYYKTGLVTSMAGERPVVEEYRPAVPMPPGWLPSVTHINGMMVMPNEGIGSAIRLQQELERASGPTVLAADVPSVLYTYSAHRGFVTDLLQCIRGKLYVGDDPTTAQRRIMLDAVRGRHRTTVSAHSRGTIKTDNAVRDAHRILSDEVVGRFRNDAGVRRQARELAQQNYDPQMGLSPAVLEPLYVQLLARERADASASRDLDQYVQLIYAGNAVQFPSAAVRLQLVVAGSDMVTISVGKYFGFAAGRNVSMTDVGGGHGFDDNYARTVADLIVADIRGQR